MSFALFFFNDTATTEIYTLSLHDALPIAPFADQVEMIGIGAVAAQHAVLHLRRRAVERVVVAVIEFVEQLDELVAPPRLHLEVIDVEVVPLRRQRYQSHCDLLLHFTSSS